MGNSLTDIYFGEEDEREPARKLPSRTPPQLRIRRVSVIGLSSKVNDDNWIEVEPRKTFTPYGNGEITGVNEDDTHYRVRMRKGVYRRIVKRNCTSQMKLSLKENQQRYSVDPSVVSTTGRSYRGVNDALKHLGSDPAVLEEVCALNDIDYSRYTSLNPGQQRMCVGNVLRGRLRRNIDIHLSEDETIKGYGLGQPVDTLVEGTETEEPTT